jgi:hypothetical protein
MRHSLLSLLGFDAVIHGSINDDQLVWDALSLRQNASRSSGARDGRSDQSRSGRSSCLANGNSPVRRWWPCSCRCGVTWEVNERVAMLSQLAGGAIGQCHCAGVRLGCARQHSHVAF